MICPGLCRLEPDVCISAGHNVRFGTKCRNRKIVEHIFRGHRQLDLCADRNMELVYFTLSGSMLYLPHPLLPYYIYLRRILGYAKLVIVDIRTAEKDRHRDNEWDDRPYSLEDHRAVNLGPGRKFFLFPILHREDKDRDDDRDRE